MTEEPPAERLADVASLRRIERTAAVWALVAGLGYGLFVSWPGALALTVVAAASIVAFRGLQRIVSALGPSQDQSERSALGAPGIGVFVRLAFLGAVVAAGAFWLRPEHMPALILGFSTLPAALTTEGFRQVARAHRDDRHDRHDR